VELSKAAQKHKRELIALAENLPFKALDIPELERPSFVVVKVRQPRTYTTHTADTQPIGRFLSERGTVELLKPAQTLDLFREIHHCAFQTRKLARKRCKTTRQWREAATQARSLISEMEAAEEELFIANRRLIVNCVKPFFWMGQVWIADFLQEGSKALSNAIRKFDFTRGTPFYAYAQKAVQNRLRNFFRDHVRSGSIGICPNRDMLMVKNLIETWKKSHSKGPDDVVLAKLTGFTEERVRKVRSFLQQWNRMPAPPVSLDASLGDTTSNLYDLIEDTEAEEASSVAERSEIWEAVDRLPPRSRFIMRLRFIEGRTLEETGQALNLTRARIKQIQDDALRKLRQMLRRGVQHPRM
jgi:RNA polymerase sigma factor (sigma-70 family)